MKRKYIVPAIETIPMRPQNVYLEGSFDIGVSDKTEEKVSGEESMSNRMNQGESIWGYMDKEK